MTTESSVEERQVKNYTVVSNEDSFEIDIESELKYDSVYKVVILKDVETDSVIHGKMSEDYEFSFITERGSGVDENDLQIIKTVPENGSENGVEMSDMYSEDIECVETFDVVNMESDGVNTIIDIKTNLEKFICIAVKKDASGRLLSCEILEGKEKIVHQYDENTEYLFWDGLETMKPLI